MMPRKDEKEKRSYLIGIKVDETTRHKINYLAGMKGDPVSTYIYEIIKRHIEEKEPWITKEIEDLQKEEVIK